MSKSIRIYNITRGYYLKYNQALHAIEQCACAWVLEGKTIRNLSLAESIAARNEQARTRDVLAFAELPGIIYQPCSHGIEASRMGLHLVREANAFASQAAG